MKHTAEGPDDFDIRVRSNKEKKTILTIVASHADGVTYAGILEESGLSTGRLDYQLGELDGFLERDTEKKFRITELGEKALTVLDDITRNIDVRASELVEKKKAKSSKAIKDPLGHGLRRIRRTQVIVLILVGLIIGGSLGTYFYYDLKQRLVARETLIDAIENEVNVLSTESLKYGVNYLSCWWHYEPDYLSNDELERDFGLFTDEGFSNVVLPLIWAYMEPAQNTYNDEALDDVVRVCNIASDYGLGVIIDFHTLMHNTSFTMPTWLIPRKFEAVLLNSTYRTAWLNYLEYCVSYLSENTSNIHSWQMMNEPAIAEWACNVTVNEFSGLWWNMRDVFKKHSDKPVSIRFGAKSLSTDFDYAPEIFEICDYISLNWYESWCSIEFLKEIVSNIDTGTRILISEFGFNESDLMQPYKIQEYVDLFLNLGINDWYAWMWRADHPTGEPEPPGIGFNLALDIEGNPRSAFYFIKPRTEIYALDNALEQIDRLLSQLEQIK